MFIAWRDLRFAKGRFALLGGVIALMTLMVVLLTGLTAGLGAAGVAAVTALPVDHVSFQRPVDGQKIDFSTSSLPASAVGDIADVPGVGDAYPLGVSTTRLTFGDATEAVNVFGTDPHVYPELSEGTAPGDGQVAVNADIAGEHGIRPGDTVTLGGQSLRVTALVEPVTLSHLPVVYTSVATWQKLAHTDGITAVLTTGDADPGAVDAAAGTTTVTREGAYEAAGGYSSEQGSLLLMRVLLLGVSILIVGAFFTVWTMQRSGDLAVVRAMGASRGYLLRDALGQALAVLVIGTAIGGGVAAGLGALAAKAVPFVLDARTVGVPAAAMILVGLLGAAVCVRRTTTVDPLTALGAAR